MQLKYMKNMKKIQTKVEKDWNDHGMLTDKIKVFVNEKVVNEKSKIMFYGLSINLPSAH